MFLHAKHITDVQLQTGIKKRIKTTVLHWKCTLQFSSHHSSGNVSFISETVI